MPTIKERYQEYQSKVGRSIDKEEVFKINVLRPFLNELGFSSDEIEWAKTIPVQIGTKKVSPEADVIISVDGAPLMVIDTKNPIQTLTHKDQLQAESYAKLIDTPPAIYAVVSNGHSTVCVNVFTNERSDILPTRDKLVRDAQKYRSKRLTEVQLREVRSTLITLMSPKDFQRVIDECKSSIERNAGIRSDQSFREMTKILLIKMAEERRTDGNNPQQNRFTVEWFKAWTKQNDKSHVDAIRFLFDEACDQYPEVYDDPNRRALQIADERCVERLVDLLEPFSLLGTGDDVKGQVYEVFLKGTLRGEFDQYFTPREIVDFMVEFAEPQIGDSILDPACGSGGFLIQAFSHVRKKIAALSESEMRRKQKLDNLIEKCLWGQETDYDLHILAKINLIMHGDGYNNIKQGDTLKTDFLPKNHFDVVLMNPPFTIPYDDQSVLVRYGVPPTKTSEEMDVLFVREALTRLKPGGMLYTVLPEGMVNTAKYREFRDWLLQHADLTLSVSLPEGAFIPFGASVSKTCIIGARKKDGTNQKHDCFVGRALFVGFDTGKKGYKQIDFNNLVDFLEASQTRFDGVKVCRGSGECGWIDADLVSPTRMDAGYLLNLIARDALQTAFGKVVRLSEVVAIENKKVMPSGRPDEVFRFFEVPAIGVRTGSLTNVRTRKGSEFVGTLHQASEGDLLFVRINPRQNRVLIVPKGAGQNIVVSPETHRLVLKKGSPIGSLEALAAIMRTTLVVEQTSRIGTGGSSSRSRVQATDLLEEVFVPVPIDDVQIALRDGEKAGDQLFIAAQDFIRRRREAAGLLNDDTSAWDIDRL